MEANAVIWIWNYISFMLHYHFMVVMTVRRWNIYRLFRRHLSNTFPEGHLGLKIHYPFIKLGPESQFRLQPIRTLFPLQHLRYWLQRPLLPHWGTFILDIKRYRVRGKWVCDLSGHNLWNGPVIHAFTAASGPGYDCSSFLESASFLFIF